MRRTSAPRLTREIPKGSCLFRQGERCEGTFVVLRGIVALSTGAQSSGELPIASAKRGAVIGLPETITNGTWQSTALAVTDVTAHFIPARDVINMMTDDTETSFRVLEMLTDELKQLHRRILSLASA